LLKVGFNLLMTQNKITSVLISLLGSLAMRGRDIKNASLLRIWLRASTSWETNSNLLALSLASSTKRLAIL